MASGPVDAALMWLTDLFLSLPQLPLLLLVIYLFRDTLKSVLGPEGGVFVLIVLVIGGLRWMPVARLVRAQFLSHCRAALRGRDTTLCAGRRGPLGVVPPEDVTDPAAITRPLPRSEPGARG